MPQITFIDFSGEEHPVDAEKGKSLMQNAIDNGVAGIDADCGGACACGTCHCFVEENWREATGEIDFMEESMLAMRPDREDGSRLSCQIEIGDQHEGLVVRLPEFQM